MSQTSKYILLYDPDGGAVMQLPVTIVPGAKAPVEGLTLSGLDLAINASSPVFGANQQYALGVECKLATVKAVDMNTAPAQVLYTVPAGYQCNITKVVFRNCSGSLTTASVSFGFDAGGTNVVATALHTGLTDSTHQDIALPKAGAVVGVAGTNGTLSCIDSILQGGAMTVTLDIFGVLMPIGS